LHHNIPSGRHSIAHLNGQLLLSIETMAHKETHSILGSNKPEGKAIRGQGVIKIQASIQLVATALTNVALCFSRDSQSSGLSHEAIHKHVQILMMGETNK
jgi:hypothetical protein